MDFFKPLTEKEKTLTLLDPFSDFEFPIHHFKNEEPHFALCNSTLFNNCPICQMLDSPLLLLEFQESVKGFWVDP